MKLYQETIEKILLEVDEDIKEQMMRTEEYIGLTKPDIYKAYQLLPDPANTILNWQAMRDRKSVNKDNLTS